MQVRGSLTSLEAVDCSGRLCGDTLSALKALGEAEHVTQPGTRGVWGLGGATLPGFWVVLVGA